MSRTVSLRREIIEAYLTGRLEGDGHLVRVTTRKVGGRVVIALWIDGKFNGQDQ